MEHQKLVSKLKNIKGIKLTEGVKAIEWFKNIKIVNKLIASFLLISLFIGIVGFIGISNMGKINSNAVSIYDDNLMHLTKLDNIRESSQLMNAEILTLLNVRDENKINRSVRNLKELEDANTKLMEEFKKSSLSPSEQLLFNQYENYIKDYINTYGKLIQIVKDVNYQEEEVLSAFQDVSEIRFNMYNVINTLIDLNIKEADKTKKINNSIYKSSLNSMIAIILLGVLLAVALGLLISVWVSRQLRKIVIFGEAIGSCDLSKKIDINF